MTENKHKRLVVLGAAESGIGAALLGKQQGWDVFVSDGGKIKHRLRFLTQYFIALACKGVLLLYECWYTATLCRIQHREAGISAYSHYRIRSEIVKYTPCLHITLQYLKWQ